MFREKNCDGCGACLMHCPEMSLGEEEAKEEILRLVRGKEPSGVLTRCSSCFSCNSYCPRECNPYHLVLSRWEERYQRLGAPPLWKFVFPTEESNLWSLLHTILPEEARRTVEAWMSQVPGETVLLPGSFFQLVPEVLAGSRLLHGAVPMALPGHWECGAYLYQGGYLDVVKKIGRMVRDDFNRWGVKRVVPALDSVHHMLTTVHPEENGTRFDQEIVGFNDWIFNKVRSGEIEVQNRLGRTVTLHDNCYAKAGGNLTFDQARSLLDLAGVRVKEMQHHHQDALCCGFGRGAGWRSNIRIPFDILKGTTKRIREAEETGCDTLVTYCAGCFWLLLAGCELEGNKLRVVHLVELLREAMGEEVAFPRRDRARDILAVMTWKILQEAGSRPTWIQSVRADPDPLAWRSRSQAGMRALRRSLDTRAGWAAFRSGFSAIDRLLG